MKRSSIILAQKLRNKLDDAVKVLLEAREIANTLANVELTGSTNLQYANVVHVWMLAEIAMRDVELHILPPEVAQRYRSLTRKH